MSDGSSTSSTSSTSGNNGSTSNGGRRLAVYAINEKEGERAWWQKIGLAFTNRDGSITLYLDALPLGTNKLQVREQRDELAPRGAGPAASGAAPGEAGTKAAGSPRRNGTPSGFEEVRS
jgi:hypothetical protein